MQVSVETINAVQSRITVEVPKEHIEPKIKKHLKSLAKKTKVNGFRPGKAPLKIIEQRYGSKVRQDVFSEVLKSSLDEAIVQEKLQVIGEPVFDKLNSDIDKIEQGLSYTITLETYPQIEVLNTDNLPVEKLIVEEISESDIDTMLNKLSQQKTTWQDVERAAKIEDRVIINFVGTINGQPFKDNEAKQVPVILGQSNVPLPGLEERLQGVSTGDKLEFDVNFPQEHNNKEIAGQKVNFIIEVSKIAEPQLPEMNAEFAKSLGIEDGSIEKLREDTRQNMQNELERGLQMKTKLQILDALLQVNPIDVPQSLVNQEAEHLLEVRKQELNIPSLNISMFKEEAAKRVKIGILVNELVKVNDIQISQDKVDQAIQKVAANFDDPEIIAKQYYEHPQYLQEIKSVVLEEHVVAFLLEKAQITEKHTDFYTAVAK
ncbi:trigger factor [Candidatus Halobeggiatoa sp. HSG11]|nr:trigger factor [Candidatus Halobeggiatoa sp. HSG11]